MELKGLFELESALKKQNKDNAIEEYKNIFSREFMIKYTDFDDIEDIFYFGGIEVKPLEEYTTVDMWMIDEVIDKYTHFSTWDAFIEKAREASKK